MKYYTDERYIVLLLLEDSGKIKIFHTRIVAMAKSKKSAGYGKNGELI